MSVAEEPGLLESNRPASDSGFSSLAVTSAGPLKSLNISFLLLQWECSRLPREHGLGITHGLARCLAHAKHSNGSLHCCGFDTGVTLGCSRSITGDDLTGSTESEPEAVPCARTQDEESGALGLGYLSHFTRQVTSTFSGPLFAVCAVRKLVQWRISLPWLHTGII